MEDYNGYPNRSTWLLALHMDNDFNVYKYIQDAPTAPTVRLFKSLVYQSGATASARSESGFRMAFVDWGFLFDVYTYERKEMEETE